MTQIGFPLDVGSVSVAEWSLMARFWMPNGVMEAQSDELQVFGDSSGRQVKVRAGIAYNLGIYYQNTAVETLALAANSSGNPRRDLVVIRLDFSVSPTTIELHVIQGTPAASPSTPAPIQTSTVWDLPLGYAVVANGAVTIASGDVVDQREWATPVGVPQVDGLISTTTSAAAARGILSVTDLATGKTQVNFRRAYSGAASYRANATPQASAAVFAIIEDSTKAAGSLQIWVYNTSGTLTDPNWFAVTARGTY